jgi:hypothetical protein
MVEAQIVARIVRPRVGRVGGIFGTKRQVGEAEKQDGEKM